MNSFFFFSVRTDESDEPLVLRAKHFLRDEFLVRIIEILVPPKFHNICKKGIKYKAK